MTTTDRNEGIVGEARRLSAHESVPPYLQGLLDALAQRITDLEGALYNALGLANDAAAQGRRVDPERLASYIAAILNPTGTEPG